MSIPLGENNNQEEAERAEPAPTPNSPALPPVTNSNILRSLEIAATAPEIPSLLMDMAAQETAVRQARGTWFSRHRRATAAMISLGIVAPAVGLEQGYSQFVEPNYAQAIAADYRHCEKLVRQGSSPGSKTATVQLKGMTLGQIAYCRFDNLPPAIAVAVDSLEDLPASLNGILKPSGPDGPLGGTDTTATTDRQNTLDALKAKLAYEQKFVRRQSLDYALAAIVGLGIGLGLSAKTSLEIEASLGRRFFYPPKPVVESFKKAQA